MRPRFFRNWVRCCARRVGSSSRQNGWPATVVGTRLTASTPEATLGNQPIANMAPAATMVTPLARTRSSVS